MGPNDPNGSRSFQYVTGWITRRLHKLPTVVRGHVVAVIGEFFGTITFLFIAFAGAQVSAISSNINDASNIQTKLPQKNPSQLLYVSLSFGFALLVSAWTFYRISGGLFNPAVTVGMVLIGTLPPIRGVFIFFTQIVGGIVAAALIRALFPGELNVSTELHPTMSIARGTILEMILTAQLCFTIFMLAAEKHMGSFIAPVGIGLSLFIGELVGVFWTGGSLNPARSFGPSVVTGEFVDYHWLYWVGPICGAVLAVIFYHLIKALEYESANPDPETGNLHALMAGQLQGVNPVGGPRPEEHEMQRPPQPRQMSPKPESMV